MATLAPALPVVLSRPVRSASSAEAPILGIGLVVLSTVFLSTSDTTAKYLAGSVHGLEIAWLRYIGYLAVMLVAAGLRSARGAAPLRTSRPGLQLLRGTCIVGSAALFLTGLRFLPIAEATALGFVAPVFVTALSIVFLGEKVGLRRWIAAFVGLCGVIIIMRPGTGAFQAAALLPICSALFWAGALVATRKINGYDAPQTTMTWSAVVGFAILSCIVPFVWTAPNLEQVGIGLMIGVISTAGHWIITIAYRHAPASTLVPFSYSQIVWAALFGFALFGTVPDVYVALGVTVIAASGLYTAHRERIGRAAAR
ncbi:DMT family transporter [uncultured Methylobacterium sp.]|uniref:DMT family transporter n=1 Tax=uncultured Methylobacterium sp. TaxID=157278 RepID=UPI002601EDF7|nr:DMT family transporter [uncultured Methylobacterium sp.]